MDKKQAQQQIQDIFQKGFHQESYLHFVRNLLNQIEPRDRHYSGNLIPEAFKDHIKQYWRIGKYIDPDGTELDLLVVEVKSLSKLERARTSLRNFAVNRLKQFDKDCSLIAFYAKDDGGDDWRFSFVKIEHGAFQDDKGKVRLKIELTPAKRYSYLVGVHENSHTAQSQLLELLTMDYANPTIEQIEAAFSIEKVATEFFEQYKGLYLVLSEQLQGQPLFSKETEEENRQAVARFAKKLLGQIVFLYFLQKKGWLGVKKDGAWGAGDRRFLGTLFKQAQDTGTNFFNNFLQYLFYEALASERKNQPDPDYYKRFACKIPFLNGGLFEAEYNWQQEKIDLPSNLFRNDAKNKSGDTGTGILDVFDRYNFTIKEDEPLEKEVAVDPEMLGKVFENMLDGTERKGKGAFYTPREIVHYMCQESLIHYLDSSLNNHPPTDAPKDLFAAAQNVSAIVPREDLETLIRNGHLFVENDTIALQAQQRIENDEQKSTKHRVELPEAVKVNARQIDAQLADIKVCDPAIGSGAFPVGLLHEIVNARLALAPHSDNPQSPYQLKRHAIRESLYGVDIDSSAIDIARLRLWLSLIVDEEDYSTIEALPNLDYKIMQGNSLVEEYWGVKLFNEEFIQEDDRNQVKIQQLKERQAAIQSELLVLYEENQLTDAKKTQLEKESKSITKLIKSLRALPKDKNPPLGLFDIRSEAKVKAGRLEQLHKNFFSVSSPLKKKEIRQQITTLEWELIEATLTERNQLDSLEKLQKIKQSNEKPFFLWKLNFPEVFKEKGGFDVVIGNPPYVQIQKFSGQQIQKNLEAQKYETFAKTGDIYCLFYEKGHHILRDGGSLCFITSNKWMRAGYGQKMREFLLEQTNIQQLIDFGDSPIFSEATTYTNILLFSASKCNSEPRAWDLSRSYRAAMSLDRMLQENIQGKTIFNNDSFVILPAELADIKKRIETVGKPLKDWESLICRGILTGFNEAFVIDGQKKNELITQAPNSAEIIKPILRGRNIKSYKLEFADLWLINTHNGYGKVPPVDIDEYPAIKQHLESVEAKRVEGALGEKAQKAKGLFRRGDQGRTPYNLRNCAYCQEFEKEKIVWLEMSPRPNFAYSKEEIFVLNTSYILTGNNLKWILPILNSSVMNCYFPLVSTDVRGKTRRYIKQYVELLPIVNFQSNFAKPVETIVDYLLWLHTVDKKLQTAYFEQLIDGLVYELYFPAEIKSAGKEILKHLGELKPISDDMSDEEKLAIIQSEFDRLYDPKHPVRNHLETLDSVKEVRIIREALKR